MGKKKERKAEKHIVNFKVWVGYEKQDPHLNMNFRWIMNTCVSELLCKIWGINVFLFALSSNPKICIPNYLGINIENAKRAVRK